MRDRQIGRAFFGLSVAATALCAVPAAAQGTVPQRYQLSEQALGSALRTVSVTSGQAIVAPSDLVAGKASRALVGTYSAEDAVARLLDGSGLVAVRVGNALVIRRQSAESAQDAQGDREGAGGEDILVTGTRIRGRAPVGALVISIDRKAIEQSGRGTVQSLLQTLPQNFGGGPGETTNGVARGNADFNGTYGSGVNLRGLGVSSTLVLLNGERPPMAGLAGVFTDLSMIPLSAVERIELLADGASALYGSDAVAGVVNIVPRDRFTGLETSARYGRADGLNELQFSGIGGLDWSSGHAVLSYEYDGRGRLAAADRPYFSEDLRRYDLGDFRSGPGVPGTIVAGGRTFAIPARQDGTTLGASQLIPNQSNAGDRFLRADALPQQRRHAAFLSVRQELTNTLELWGQALFGERRYDSRLYATFNALPVTVPVTNPFYVDPIGTRQPVVVRYDFSKELGPEAARGMSRAFGATLGARLSLGQWQVNLGATHGLQTERSYLLNLLNSARAAAALADTNRATALNVFGDGSANNPGTLARIRGSVRTGGSYSMWSGQLRADGPLFDLPAGAVRLAIGAERRNEHYAGDRAVYDYTTLAPIPAPTAPLIGNRHVTAGYAELFAPVTGPGAFPGRLELSAAVRGERYSGFGDTVNPKFGGLWEPVSGLKVRASWGTSFRAPNFNDVRQDAATTAYQVFTLPNPASPTGTTNTLVIRGNDPDLGPEKATSWTAGVELGDGSRPGVHAQVTWFDIDYRDRIASPASALQTFFTNRTVYAPIIDDTPDSAEVAAYYASPYFVRSTTIPASAVAAIVDARTQNLASQRMRGFDFDLGYRFDLAGGAAGVGASGSYIASFRQKLTRSAPVLDIVGTIGNPPDLRVRGRASWTGKRFGFAALLNYTDGYSNATSGTVKPVASWTTLDLQASYRIDSPGPLAGLSLSLSVVNLFDADPPLTAYLLGGRTIGYDVENASPLGRFASIQVTKRW